MRKRSNLQKKETLSELAKLSNVNNSGFGHSFKGVRRKRE